MKSITYAEFLEFGPCYLRDPEKKALMDSIAQRNERWTALDILELKEIPDEDKLWAVLREDLIEPEKLHEFACVCAERALSRVEHPDPRSVEAIKAKRAWMKGEISDAELAAAWDAASDAARAAARDAAMDAAWDAAWATASGAAWDAASDAAWAAARDAAWAAARAAARTAARVSARAAARTAARVSARDAAMDAAWDAAWASERAWQVEELKKMLMEVEA